MSTRIEWTDETWNPIAGCSAVSAGCTNCYAAGMTRRLEAMGIADYVGLSGKHHFNGAVRTLPRKLTIPLRWKKPRMIFVNSMSDLFHADVPFGFIDQVFAVMALCPQHTFQVLTKRPERMAEYLNDRFMLGNHLSSMGEWCSRMAHVACEIDSSLRKHRPGGHDTDDAYDRLVHATLRGYVDNVHIGTSIENQATANHRIPWLTQCPAVVRFLSYEPALGPVVHSLNGIHWVICGGESGSGAQPMHPGWARSMRDQCQEASVPFFFKQWGAWAPACAIDTDQFYNPAPKHDPERIRSCKVPSMVLQRDGSDIGITYPHGAMTMFHCGKHLAGRLLDDREHSEFPEAPR